MRDKLCNKCGNTYCLCYGGSGRDGSVSPELEQLKRIADALQPTITYKEAPTKTPDEKVLELLERAENILVNAKQGVWEFGAGIVPEKQDVIEIAKMIQIEENK